MHSSRRRKKRLNYGVRTVDVERGPNGFGFTISGQQPCILSCIVANSPADISGLRAGDFLMSVNGISVSKLAHDAVVTLIGNCFGPIQMTIAENYYSDSSSDEDTNLGRIVNVRKQKFSHKPKAQRNIKQGYKYNEKCQFDVAHSSKRGVKPRECTVKHNTGDNNRYSPNYFGPSGISYQMLENAGGLIEFKAIVGYLGTIEMPKQLLPNSRFETVVSCIRKLRQEKRIPTAVLMTILPTCLTLKNSSHHILAIYPTNRVVYINSSGDKDCRYFGLVTSAVSDLTEGIEPRDISPENPEKRNNLDDKPELSISNSCHVFITDSKIVDHEMHAKKAEIFKISCTVDVVSDTCLEFPRNAIYVVKLIQNMYKLEDVEDGPNKNEEMVAISPQPSASSNSDSGIGYRDECGNISDRILVVEFPLQPLPILPNNSKRPANITASNITAENLDAPSYNEQLNNSKYPFLQPNYNMEAGYGEKYIPNINNIRACEALSIKNVIDKQEAQNSKLNRDIGKICNRLTVRVMPNSSPKKDETSDLFSERPVDVPVNTCPKTKRSCETGSLHSVDDIDFRSSIDNISVHSSKSIELSNLIHVFKAPSSKYFEYKKTRKYLKPVNSCDNLSAKNYDDRILSYKLSPKVYGVAKPTQSCEELNSHEIEKYSFGSLQDLRSSLFVRCGDVPNVTQSYPDIRIEKQDICSASTCVSYSILSIH